MRFTSTGTLRYFQDPLKLVLLVDQGISDFYYSLIPLYTRPYPIRQKFKAHISVVRNVRPDMHAWGKHSGVKVEFEYDPLTRNDDTYYWLNAWSPALEDIRRELGLPIADAFTRSPDGTHRFHITIGNTKTPEQILKKQKKRERQHEPRRSQVITVERVYRRK